MAPQPAPLLAFEGSSKRYGRGAAAVEALAPLDVALDGGRIVGLLGPIGSGKTTCLRLASGMLEPDTGRVLLDGAPPAADRAELARAVGWCGADERSFYPRLSCRENLRFHAALLGLPATEGDVRIAALAAELGFEDTLERRFHACSSGQRQRLNLARALLAEPRILLLDEPFRALDTPACERLVASLRRRARERGTLVVWTGHRHAELEAASDELLHLDAGRLVDAPRAAPPSASASALPGRIGAGAAGRTPAFAGARPRRARQLAAFLRRDRLEFTAHKLEAALKVGLLATWVLVLYFVSRLVDAGDASVARWIGGAYFGYALVGLTGLRFSQVFLAQVSSGLREEQLLGTLEPLVASSRSPLACVFGTLAWPLVSEGATMLALLAASGAFLGVRFEGAELVPLALAALLTLAALALLCVLSASFVLAFQRGDPVTLVLSLVTLLFGGVFFPREFIPSALQPLASILPLTHGLEAARAALGGAGFGDARYREPLGRLAVLAAVLAPLAFVAWHAGLGHARRRGTLTHA